MTSALSIEQGGVESNANVLSPEDEAHQINQLLRTLWNPDIGIDILRDKLHEVPFNQGWEGGVNTALYSEVDPDGESLEDFELAAQVYDNDPEPSQGVTVISFDTLDEKRIMSGFEIAEQNYYGTTKTDSFPDPADFE